MIVGGGVIGLTTAYFLARDGFSVRVLDRSAPGSEASWAGAGILPPGNPAGARAPLDRLRAESSVMFPGLSAELRQALARVQPATLGAASRVPGITPAALTLLYRHAKRAA